MGLCNASAISETLMNIIFREFIDLFMVVYLDDLLIFRKTEDENLLHIEAVLKILKENFLYASPKKWSFMMSEVKFLGLIAGRNGIRVNERKMDVVRDWRTPKTVRDIRSFICLEKFFWSFVQGFSGRAKSLTDLTKNGVGISKANVTRNVTDRSNTWKGKVFWEALGMVVGWKRFRWYLEGLSIDFFPENQFISRFFSKPHLGRRESRRLQLLS